MGRKPSEPTLNPKGEWVAWHPGLKRKVKLGVANFEDAKRAQASFYPDIRPDFHGGILESNHETPSLQASSVIDFDKAIGDDTPKVATDDPLASWLNKSQPSAAVPPPTPSVGQGQPSVTSSLLDKIGLGNATGKPAVTSVSKVQKGMSPEDAAKLASGLKKMMVNINTVAVGGCIQMFGVEPCPLDGDEIRLLEMGWEMWLDEIFAKKKIKPVYLVLLGNVMIAFSMYVGGKKIPKVGKVEGKQGAPGHLASVSAMPSPLKSPERKPEQPPPTPPKSAQ